MSKSKKQFNLYKPKTVEGLYFASIIILIFSFFVLGTALLIKTTDKSEAVDSVNTVQPFNIGEYFTTGQVGININSVDYSVGSEPFIAPESMQYAVINLSITSRDDNPITILPTIDTYIKTTDGTVSYLSPYALKNPFRAGELLPGETIQGELSFLVKKDTPLNFYIDSIWSGSSIPIKIY